MSGTVNAKLMFVLCLLCLFDAAATDIGLQKDYIREANPLMDWIYKVDRILFYGCKIVMPLILWRMCYYFFNRAWFKCAVNICVIIYSIVCFYHFYWMSLVYLS